jgi:hypothetical protein
LREQATFGLYRQKERDWEEPRSFIVSIRLLARDSRLMLRRNDGIPQVPMEGIAA